MQGKVSMVVPCYNKVLYIGAMLDSVIAQEWDNIELILVNDGSTDGTREIITGYEPKLKDRGFDVIIIDQENAGCCAAVYAGLMCMSGDYFCLVDCDDLIEPKYVMRMASWLDAYAGCKWAACTFSSAVYSNVKIYDRPLGKMKYRPDAGKLLERHMYRTTLSATWIYMARICYLKECDLIENFCTERRTTYEPLIIAPLAFGGGKLEFFNEPLYVFNIDGMGLSKFDNILQCASYYDDYFYLYNWAIDRLKTSENEKQRLRNIARFGYYKDLYRHAYKMPENSEFMDKITGRIVNTYNTILQPSLRLKPKVAKKIGLHHIFNEIEEAYVEA